MPNMVPPPLTARLRVNASQWGKKSRERKRKGFVKSIPTIIISNPVYLGILGTPEGSKFVNSLPA
jgi:hypothetical protein